MTTPVPDALFRGLPERVDRRPPLQLPRRRRIGGPTTGAASRRSPTSCAAIGQAGEVGRGATVWLAGYSFGADVSLQVADDRIAGWVLIAPTLRTVPPASMLAGDDDRPKHLLVPEHDQFCGPADAEVFVVRVRVALDLRVGGPRGRPLPGRPARPVVDGVVAALDRI